MHPNRNGLSDIAVGQQFNSITDFPDQADANEIRWAEFASSRKIAQILDIDDREFLFEIYW